MLQHECAHKAFYIKMQATKKKKKTKDNDKSLRTSSEHGALHELHTHSVAIVVWQGVSAENSLCTMSLKRKILFI